MSIGGVDGVKSAAQEEGPAVTGGAFGRLRAKR